jgi:hypothetical protein
MKPKILILLAVILLAVVAAVGFFWMSAPKMTPPSGNKPSSMSNDGDETPPAEPEPEAIAPLRLDYELKNFGPGQNINLAYFFEKKQICADRAAYLGVAKLESSDGRFNTQYAKLAAYEDNGELGFGTWTNEGSLAFDDAIPYFNEMNVPLFVSELFIVAGKNFNDEAYWRSGAPVILKDVVFGRSKGNYSIIYQGEDATAAVPCTKFKIVGKTTNMDGYFNVCVAKKINEVNLPLMVYMEFENEQGPQWRLKSATEEASGITWTPQCLEAVWCPYVAEPVAAERSRCAGQIEPKNGSNGCVEEYRCISETDQAKNAIMRTQNPDCAIDQKLLEKYLTCRRNNQPNYDPVKYGNDGCLQDIKCRP